MSVMTIAVTAVQDLNGFVDASNSYGKQRVLDMGCKHTSIAKIVMGGEAAGLCGVSFEWESVDAAIAGSNAINSDGQMLQMMGDCGVSVVRRSVLDIIDSSLRVVPGAAIIELHPTGLEINSFLNDAMPFFLAQH